MSHPDGITIPSKRGANKLMEELNYNLKNKNLDSDNQDAENLLLEAFGGEVVYEAGQFAPQASLLSREVIEGIQVA